MDLLRNIFKGDKVVWIIFLFLCLISVVEVFSASSTLVYDSGNHWAPITRHAGFLLAGAVVMWVFHLMPYHWFQLFPRVLIFGAAIFLVLLLMFDDLHIGGILVIEKTNEAGRWVRLFGVPFQPSEFAKIIMIVCTAALLSERVGQLNTFRSVLPVGLFIGIPFLLVLKQPDLGTSLVFLAIGLGMVFVSRIKLSLLRNIAAVGVVLAPIGWHFLKDYQKARITVFLDPNADPFGAGYHIIQSKIAIGSGMLFGKGLFQGSQSQLNFLPENHTDFIFSVIGEELGFLGCVFLLFLYFVLIYRGLMIAKECKEPFGMLLATGVISMWTFQILVNVGMTCGIMPVTGIPLPFMSYGVSALTTNMVGLGILLSVYMHQQTMIF